MKRSPSDFREGEECERWTLGGGPLAVAQLPGTRQAYERMPDGFWERPDLVPCCGDVMNDDGQGRVLESLSFQERLRTANDRV